MGSRIVGFAVGILVLACALAVVGLRRQMMVALRAQNRVLDQRLEELRRLEAENLRLNQLLAESRPDTPDRLQEELARLRHQAERLRPHRVDWEKLCAENRELRAELGQGVRPTINRDAWTYLGYADPEAALQSTFWAWASADPAMVVGSLRPADRAAWANWSDEQIAARMKRTWRLSSGFQILGQKKVSDDEIAVIVNAYPDRPDIANAELHFQRIGSEWKLDCGLHPMAPPEAKEETGL